jgi:hypothetical protein
MSTRFRLALAFAALLAAAPASAQAPEPDRLFPVTLSVDGEPVRTTIALRLPFKVYGRSFAALTGDRLDDDERAVVQFAEALRTNDVRSVRTAMYNLPAEPAPSGSTISVSPRTPEQFLAAYRQSFNSFANVTLEARVPVDDGVLFLWRGTSAKGPMLRGFTVRLVEGRRRITEVTMARPVEVFIVNTLGRLTSPELATAAAPAGNRNSTLPLTRTGVALEFRTERLNADAFVAPAAARPGAVGAVQAAARALKDRKLDDLYALHTMKSADKLRQWFATMKGELFDSFVLGQSTPRFVKFVVDGGPVLLVFSAPTMGNDWPAGSLHYDYVRLIDGRFRLANVLYSTFFDDMLKATPDMPRLVKGGIGSTGAAARTVAAR